FVWVNRDTRDIALSAWRTYLTGGARWRHSLADARTYLSAHEKMMVDWCEMFPDRIYRLNYEDLARSPQAEVNDLMRFLELPAPDLSMSDLLGATVSTASFAQIRSKITTRSVGGWKTYERWFNPVFD
ncbi:MAG: sulfotransferase, partial [Pseudomonadota bacterium]